MGAVVFERRVLARRRDSVKPRVMQFIALPYGEPGPAVDREIVVRRRIAGELHDGPQQRLVTLFIALTLARAELPTAPAQAALLLDQALGEAQAVIDELRELVAAIHPSILDTRGLGAALEALAARCPLPVTFVGHLDQRYSSTTETQAFSFVVDRVIDAIGRVGASRIDVRIEVVGNALAVGVSNDAPGAAILSAEFPLTSGNTEGLP
jgi:signal transduction histidine kinase